MIILTILWVSIKAEQVSEMLVRLASGAFGEWMVARSSQSSALAGQDTQLARQTAATERSNMTREKAGRLGTELKMLQTTNKLTLTG